MKYKLSNKILRNTFASQLSEAEQKLAASIGAKLQYEGSSSEVKERTAGQYTELLTQIDHWDTVCDVLKTEIERLDNIIKKEPTEEEKPGRSQLFEKAAKANQEAEEKHEEKTSKHKK